MSIRHNTFPEIFGLDDEFDVMLKEIEMLKGKIVSKLPDIREVQEFSRFFIKQESGNYKEFIKLEGKFIER